MSYYDDLTEADALKAYKSSMAELKRACTEDKAARAAQLAATENTRLVRAKVKAAKEALNAAIIAGLE